MIVTLKDFGSLRIDSMEIAKNPCDDTLVEIIMYVAADVA